MMQVLTFILEHVNSMILYSLTMIPYNSQLSHADPKYHRAVGSPEYQLSSFLSFCLLDPKK